MTTEQAYIEGFVKRAAECGFNEAEVLTLLKTSETQDIQYPAGYKKTLDSAVNAAKGLGQKGLALGRRAGEALYGGAETLSDSVSQFANYISKDNPNVRMGYNTPRVRIPISNYAGNITSDPGYLNINNSEMTVGPIVSAAKGMGKGINTLAKEMSTNQNTLNGPGFVGRYELPKSTATPLAKVD